ncbi:exodeoxyribonuclease I [Arsenophonus symbiont of Ornithomya chloropus]|uniref:exodeoxyribonuclease I n=1 Tax=Arsenophonus symbiont of Ornithomya chloropus TaxID=634121 RepID=UPI0032B2043D
MINTQEFSFLFYDYETFGKNPALDRPAQFASIRTDADFNFIEEPKIFFCSPANDYLPDPEAVIVNGITPQYAIANGISEAKFAKHIYSIFSVGNTCILGYNNIQFDDEVSRYIFYRNFYDPYDYSWKSGNSRWDLINVLRACYTLRPHGIYWPNNNGLPSFKLEDLTNVNNVKHLNAHNAIGDVLATIEIAKLIKKAQPRLFDYFFKLRKKYKIMELVNCVDMTPLIYISSIFGAAKSNISIIAPLTWHPKNKNVFIAYDLAKGINKSLKSNNNILQKYDPLTLKIRNKYIDNVKLININKCPILAPINLLKSVDLQRISLNINYCMNNWKTLKKDTQIQYRITRFFSQETFFPELNDVDHKLYAGFFTNKDRLKMNIIRHTSPKNLSKLKLKFDDPRINQLFFRYRSRNYPNTLTKQEKLIWSSHRENILNREKINKYLQNIDNLFLIHINDKKKCSYLRELVNYVHQITN